MIANLETVVWLLFGVLLLGAVSVFVNSAPLVIVIPGLAALVAADIFQEVRRRDRRTDH